MKQLLYSIGFLFTTLQLSAQDCTVIERLPSKDSTFLNPLMHCLDSTGQHYFQAEISTTVCKDSLCQVLEIDIYWDFAGNYLRFDTIAGTPLTKHDHEPFEGKDYSKLDSSLSNAQSILGEKTEEELIDNTEKKYSEVIDGYSGATSKEIKSAVVDGAPYTTYTLWHTVYGKARRIMRKYAKKNMDEEAKLQLIASSNPQTVVFSLKYFEEQEFMAHSDKVFELLSEDNPLVNFYIAKNLPVAFFQSNTHRMAIEKLLPTLDRNTRSVMKMKMVTVEK